MKRFIAVTLVALFAILPLLTLAVSAADPKLIIQAEEQTFTGNWQKGTKSWLTAPSTGSLLEFPNDDQGNTGTMEAKLDGLADGNYDIVLYFCNEADGNGTWVVELNGKEIKKFKSDDKRAGSPDGDILAFTNTALHADWAINNVAIKKGDTLKVTYTFDDKFGGNGERGRFDRVEFYAAGTAPAPNTTTTKAATTTAATTSKATTTSGATTVSGATTTNAATTASGAATTKATTTSGAATTGADSTTAADTTEASAKEESEGLSMGVIIAIIAGAVVVIGVVVFIVMKGKKK